MHIRIRTIIAAGTVAGLLLVGTPAFADQRALQADPNDTPGRLDMNGIGMIFKNSGALLVGVRTFDSWRDGLLASDRDNRVLFYFNVDSDRRTDYIGRISMVDGALQMAITGGRRALEPLPVSHDAGTIRVKIPANSPLSRAGVDFYAKTRLKGSGSCARTCVDRAPDRSALRF